MKCVFLYAELMPNLIVFLRQLVKAYNAEISVVYWDRKKKTPYKASDNNGITFYKRSQHNRRSISRLVENIAPDIIYIVGWMDVTYLQVIYKYRRNNTPVVVGLDDWWTGSIRQRFASGFLSPFLTRLLFSHAWVAGARQYEYAKRLGFRDDHIIQNLLSCDTVLFNSAYNTLQSKASNYPRVFLYVGRFSTEKGTELLAEAFERYRTKYKGEWKLKCVGNGPLQKHFDNQTNVEVLGFSSQQDVVNIMSMTGAFIMPSIRDFSPLAVHEAACAGLPLIISSNVGNAALFLIQHYNGLIFESGSADELALSMHRISSKSVADLIMMGERSYKLSTRIDPEITAASFLSCIKAD